MVGNTLSQIQAAKPAVAVVQVQVNLVVQPQSEFLQLPESS